MQSKLNKQLSSLRRLQNNLEHNLMNPTKAKNIRENIDTLSSAIARTKKKNQTWKKEK